MKWDASDRRKRLPRNWRSIRTAVMKRDGYRCRWRFQDEDGNWVRCQNPARDVDHRKPGDDHSMGNLWALCGFHHDKKTALEGRAAREQNRREISQRFRRTEEHPAKIAGAMTL